MNEKLLFKGPNSEARFISYINFTDDCWIWTGALQRGYGSYKVGSKICRPHRIVWANYVDSDLPDYPDATLDHICENRACVNPDHLEPKSIGDNVRAGSNNSAKKTLCPQGHEYTEENTWVNNRGARICKTCQKERRRMQWLLKGR